jgi:hypothetical protein
MAETMGTLVDKLCIAELKIFHMQEQTERSDAGPAHRALCAERVQILTRQRDDLASELNQLAGEWVRGRWFPKVYRQFKMYNDPTFKISEETVRDR